MAAHHDNPLTALSAEGVSVWLDDLSRELLAGGQLESLIADRSVVGITTNPTIFAAALSRGDRYTSQLRALAESGTSVDDAVFVITTDDVRAACRILRPVHDRTNGPPVVATAVIMAGYGGGAPHRPWVVRRAASAAPLPPVAAAPPGGRR